MKEESSRDDSGSEQEPTKGFKDDGDVRDVRYNLERLHEIKKVFHDFSTTTCHHPKKMGCQTCHRMLCRIPFFTKFKERAGGCQQEPDDPTIDLGVQTSPSAAIGSPPQGLELTIK